MELHVDDDGFVRAPRGLVYRRMTDLAGWATCWPGARIVAAGDGAFDVRLQSRPGATTVQMRWQPHGWRHDEGFRLRVTGDLVGEAEFWLEEGWGGTVVHHLGSFEVASRRPHAVATAARAGVRRGLWGLKDDLQGHVRAQLGLVS